MKNISEVQRLRYLVYKKYNSQFKAGDSYTNFGSGFGLFGVVDAGFNFTYQFVGTFSGDVFVSNDGKNLIFVISDAKSLESLLYRLGSNHERAHSGVYGNTYQKYIWSEPINNNFLNEYDNNAPYGRDETGRANPMAIMCFTAETKILMGDRLEKTIDKIVIGDTIMTVDIDNMKLEQSVVEEVVVVNHNDLVVITFEDGTEITNTADHPYFVKGKTWASVDICYESEIWGSCK